MNTTNSPESRGTALSLMKDYMQSVLCVPFDLARENYSRAVNAGLIERSMLASAKFGRSLAHLEAITLGPFARGR